MDRGLWHHTGGIDQPPPRKRNAKRQNGCLLVSSVTQLWCHGLQHASPPCSSPTLGAWSNSHALSRWCHPTISSSVIHFSSSLQSFPESGFFPMSPYHHQVAKVLEFHEYSGLISCRIDWFDLLAVHGALKSLLQHHSSKASIFWRSAFFIVQFSYPYMTTGKTVTLTRRTFVGKSNASAFYYAV